MTKHEMALIAVMALFIGASVVGIYSALSHEGVENRRENRRYFFISECAMRRPASECAADARMIYP